MEYTKDELNLIKQFAEMLAEQIFASKNRGADGFEFRMTNPETDEEVIKIRVWGQAFKDIQTEEGFSTFIYIIAPHFVSAFKKAYKID